MNIPKLKPTSRNNEFNQYTQEQRDRVVYNYIFKGVSHRDLDETVLNLDKEHSKGWQTMGILHHLGLRKELKGIFKGLSEDIAIQELLNTNDEGFRWLIECIERETQNFTITGVFDSWQIISNSVVLKTTDKSIFEHHGTGIPKDTRVFWGIDILAKGEKHLIKVVYKDVQYNAYFQRETNEPYRTRLFWYSDLQEEIRSVFPNYKTYETYKDSYPIMRFEKIENDVYHINFIVSEYLREDIEIESKETIEGFSTGNKEGRESYFYSKKYERNSKNRLEAIKIHGTKCVCCGFDFEKTYGERGIGYIEIHHLNPLYNLDVEVIINPKEDLVPVCSNCHRIIHRRKDDVLTVGEIKELIVNNKSHEQLTIAHI